MAERPQLAALLLNFRQPQLTGQCLQDLLAVGDVPLAILVIDNGSGDDSAAPLHAAVQAARGAGRDVELLLLPENVGFGAAMNQGFAWAAARSLPFALVLNNDLRLPAEFLAPLLSVLQRDVRAVAVGPTVLQPDGRVWAQGGSLGFCANGLRLRGHGGPPAPTTLGPQAVEFLPGACVLFRTAAVRAVAGFDARFFMYWEDVDLCRRLRAAGGTVLWLPWVRVTHAGAQSSGGGRSPLRKFMMANNLVHYLRAHGTWAQWTAFWLLDVLLWPLALGSGTAAAVAKLRGTISGLRGRRADRGDVARLLGAGVSPAAAAAPRCPPPPPPAR